jgi:hypothetical protein
MMMMTYICPCRNNNQSNAIYPLGTFATEVHQKPCPNLSRPTNPAHLSSRIEHGFIEQWEKDYPDIGSIIKAAATSAQAVRKEGRINYCMAAHSKATRPREPTHILGMTTQHVHCCSPIYKCDVHMRDGTRNFPPFKDDAYCKVHLILYSASQ